MDIWGVDFPDLTDNSEGEGKNKGKDTEPQINKAAELQKEWKVETGELEKSSCPGGFQTYGQ